MSSNLSATATASIYLPIPAGMVIAYMGKVENLDGLAKLGWLVCNGAAVSRKTFPDLFAAIGTTYGGDGSPNFNLPQLQGFFLRGVDTTGKQDPDSGDRTSPIPGVQTKVGPVVGSVQGFAIQNHLHHWWNIFSFVGDRGSDLSVQLGEHSPVKGTEPAQPTTMYDGGGSETRPSNVYVYYLIFSGLPQVSEHNSGK